MISRWYRDRCDLEKRALPSSCVLATSGKAVWECQPTWSDNQRWWLELEQLEQGQPGMVAWTFFGEIVWQQGQPEMEIKVILLFLSCASSFEAVLCPFEVIYFIKSCLYCHHYLRQNYRSQCHGKVFVLSSLWGFPLSRGKATLMR